METRVQTKTPMNKEIHRLKEDYQDVGGVC